MNLLLAASLAFGRDNARYWQVIGILTVISVILWLFVAVTTLLRVFFHLGWYIRRRSKPDKHVRYG